MAVITERAPAKVNLTLEVRGRRADGYHELLSLVAFADVADVLTLDTEGKAGASLSGPYVGDIAGPNLIETAVALLRERAPELAIGAVQLEKRLPVAAGIGGGSADAAALLRAVAAANPEAGKSVDWLGLATKLGADVAVCLGARAAWMSGAGETVVPIEGGLPPLAAVLVNSCAPVPADKTGRVFRSLGAPSLAEGGPRLSVGPAIGSRSELIALLAAHGNDLETPARTVMPEIARVMAALHGLADVEAVRLSGAGPTAFGIFADAGAAAAAADQLRRSEPRWWIEATTLG